LIDFADASMSLKTPMTFLRMGVFKSAEATAVGML